MHSPLVSILIPFKNTENFLEDCLQSICNQDYKNWEVLAINDHSSDNSTAIVGSFCEKDNRFKLFENSGNGIISALRTAYTHSKGVLITRMDSDDIMMPNKIKVMAELLLEKGENHLAVGKVKYFSDRGISNGYERYEKWLNELTEKGTNYSEIYKECVIPSPCWMTHRKDLDRCEAFEPDRYPEDYDLAFRFYEKGLSCISCNEVLHHWRDYDSRTSRTSEHYAQNYFLDIKLNYFLKLDHFPTRPLVVWGAGTKGKKIAKALVEKEVEFHWFCDNPNKIGKDIYGKSLAHYSELEQLKKPQTIITVANEAAQMTINTYLKQLKQISMEDYFFFC